MNNQLYALSSENRLSLLNVDTGAATLVATLNADVTTAAVGLDFDPVSDQLRVVNDADENFRINPTTGAVTTEGSLAFRGHKRGQEENLETAVPIDIGLNRRSVSDL